MSKSGVIVKSTEEIKISTIRTYDKNPRIGNVDIIAESLSKNGQFKPIVVNKRTMQVLAGNHTYLAARSLGWETIYASYIDVDDDTAKRIVLADNKTSDMGTYDDSILAELLASLPEVTGTGYSVAEVDDLMKSISADAAEASKGLDDLTSLMPSDYNFNPEKKKDPRQEILDDEDEAGLIASQNRGAARTNIAGDTELEDLEDVQTELQALLELREDTVYPFDNFWGIPELRRDMLLEELPASIKTWAGHDASPDDGVSHYLYNYGLGGIKGLPFDRAILSFFTHDHKFNNWWELPAYYTAKVISAGTRIAICPDFSFYYTMPRAVHLQGVYQSQWLGRFFQESGMQVIPRIQFDDEKSLEFCLLGIPKNPPMVAISVQNFGTEDKNKKEDEKQVTKIIQMALDKVEPTKNVIIYGGNPAKRVLESLDLHGAVGVHIENYAAVRRGTVFDKKDGVSKLTATQKKHLKEKVQQEEAARLGISLDELKKSPQTEDEDY